MKYLAIITLLWVNYSIAQVEPIIQESWKKSYSPLKVP